MDPNPADTQASAGRLQRLLDLARELDRDHAPVGSDRAVRVPLSDLAAAVLRMRVRPALEATWDSEPPHVTVFGGTNTGKSTVLNVLLGRAACGMKVTARYSQHPEAWRAPAAAASSFEGVTRRFEGYALYRGETPPRQSDQELSGRGWRRALGLRDVEPGEEPGPVDPRAVYWDAPDFSTEEAQAWLSGVVDVVAIAEVVVFVVTDESYSDDRGRTLLELVAGAGPRIEVCANKIGSASDLFEDVRTKLGAEAAGVPFGLHGLPLVEGADPSGRLARLLESGEARALRAAVAARLEDPRGLKRDVLGRTLLFFDQHLGQALEPLRAEARVSERWSAIVRRSTERELVRAYRETYLNTRRYQEFQSALVEVMRLLEIPGIGPVVSAVGRLARLPLNLVRRAWQRVASPPAGSPAEAESEERVVARLFKAWLASLRSEAQTLARAEEHRGWARVERALSGETFQAELVEEFRTGYRAHRQRLDARIAESARAIHARIEESPRLKHGLRAANLVGDAGVTIGAVAAGGLSPADLLLGPLAHALWEELVERGLGSYVRAKEEELKREQMLGIEELFRSRLESTARALFAGRLDPAELERAGQDWAAVRRALEDRLEVSA